jgi:dihydropteroate synthase
MQGKQKEQMFILNCKGKVLVLTKPIVMGIINATPDSFFKDSRKVSIAASLEKSGQMIEDGATIIDVGGQSTRPGSDVIAVEEELERVVPVIQAIAAAFPEIYISVDTYYAEVAKAAVGEGACIVNDISGGLLDVEMIPTVASLKVPYICMHMQGTPKTMQVNPVYENVTNEVLDFFIKRIAICKEAGIKDVIMDVGFGFGKTLEHNYQLLHTLEAFNMLDKPLLVGVSRKGMVYKPLGITAANALNGTTVLNTIALQKGATILRVHDVKEVKEAIDLLALMG